MLVDNYLVNTTLPTSLLLLPEALLEFGSCILWRYIHHGRGGRNYRILYHILYYNTVSYNPCGALLPILRLFFLLILVMQQPTMTRRHDKKHVYMCFFFVITQGEGYDPRPDSPLSVLFYFFLVCLIPSVSVRALIRSPIHDLRVSIS